MTIEIRYTWEEIEALVLADMKRKNSNLEGYTLISCTVKQMSSKVLTLSANLEDPTPETREA